MEEMNKTPRAPAPPEWERVIDFLNRHLRMNIAWPITREYPTALSSANLHNMSVIMDDEDREVLSHAMLRPFICKTPYAVFKIGGIGSVVTDPNLRHRGLSSRNIMNCIDMSLRQDCDFVILWSDQYDFYRKFGFELAGFEHSFMISQARPIKNGELRLVKGTKIDPHAILKLYNQHTVNSVRTVEEVSQYLNIPNSNVFTLWNQQHQLVAYAVEGKGVDLQTYIHEWGGSVPDFMDLLSHMIQTEKQTYTVICPHHALNLRQQLKGIADYVNDGFLGMIKVNNFERLASKIKKVFAGEGISEITLEKNGDEVVFGHMQKLYQLKGESDFVKLLFGPSRMSDLTFVDEETQKTFAKIFPLPLWVWGWDSV